MSAGPAGVPTVIYVAGSGRSGSTLLERTLGEITGFVNVGELIDLFRRVVREGERCGCNEPFESCPFWSGVGREILDGWDPDEVDAVDGVFGDPIVQRSVVAERSHCPANVH
jgi:hypothetical protein